MNNLVDIQNVGWNSGKAYILGLVYPKLSIAKIEDDLDGYYLVGLVSHNANQIDETELTSHFLNVTKLIGESELNKSILLRNIKDFKLMNRRSKVFRRSGKSGFGVLLKIKTINSDLDDFLNDINDTLNEIIKTIPSDYIDWFIAGTIDGRSSYDTTTNYIALDIDRDYEKQDILERILERSKYKYNLNKRDLYHEKEDQLRYDGSERERIINKIPLLSECRKKKIKESIQ